MTTQEAIYKLENYDELEGKYNEALARIDEYERERADVLAKIAITKEEIKKAGMISKALNFAINMLEPPALEDDDFEVGDIIKDMRDGQIGVFLGESSGNEFSCLIYSQRYKTFSVNVECSDDCWQKTDKHYPQIAEILSKVRGENDESSENSE